MKNKFLKIGLIPSMFAILSPTIAMTSCGSVSQWDLPFLTNGGNVIEDQDANAIVDHKGNLIKDYAPSSFVYSSSQTSDKLHAYCEPQDADVVDDLSKETTFLPKEYYSPGSQKMAITNTKDKEKPVKLFRNINISQLTNGVLSISNNLSHLYSYMLSYQARSEILDIKEMAKMFGIEESQVGLTTTFNKDSPENANFFEFNFALNNLLSEGKSKIKFGISGYDFNFKNFLYTKWGFTDKQFGFGPLPNSGIEERFVGQTSGANMGHNPTDGDVNNNYGFDDHVRLTTAKMGDTVDTMVVPSTIESIPIPISSSNLQLAFYNPLVAQSFLPNEWLINNTTEINEKIATTKSWKNFSKYSNAKSEVNSLSWNINCSVNNSVKNTQIWPTNSDSIFKLYQDDLKYSDFIVLANYGYTAEKAKDSTKPGEVERALVFTGISGIYPSFFFGDEKAFKETEVKIPNKDESEKRYFSDKKYLDDRLTKLNKSLTAHEKNNEDLKTLLRYSFLKNTGTNWAFDVNNYLTRRY